MALLKFKKGLFSALPATKSEGTVYITSDTREMYVDVSADTRIAIGKFRIIATEAALAALGGEGAEGRSTESLYYVEETKLLKKWNGTSFDVLNDTTDLANLGKIVAAHSTAITALQTKDGELETAIGNINASTVDTTKKIKVTTPVGNYTKGQTIDINDIQSILVNMLSQDANPVATAPRITSVTLSGAGSKEVGEKFTPSASIATNAGKYTANGVDQVSGVTFNNYRIVAKGTVDGTTALTDEAAANKATFTQFTVTDKTDYYVQGSCSNSAGVVPKTYLGADYPAAQIKAGTLGPIDSSHVKGYRGWFYGFKNGSNAIADPTAITSDQIRALNKNNGAWTNSMDVSAMKQMFFAAPKGKGYKPKVADSKTGAPQTVLGPIEVNVEGANHYTAITYEVWYVNNAQAASGSATLNITRA